MRISTAQYYSMNVASMSDQQAQLSQIYQQIASGSSLQTAADNPLNAAQAVQLSATATTLSQYSTNQNQALSTLGQEDSTLTSVISTLQNIHTLALRAGDGSLNDGDRGSLATQLEGLRSQLVTLANSTDTNGNYLFSGFQSTAQPFSTSSSGAVVYNGDTGNRQVQVAGSRTIQSADNGLSVFMSVAAVGTSSVPAGASTNTGTGVIGSVSVNNPADSTNNNTFSINFTGSGDTSAYTVTSTDPLTGVSTTSASQAYTAGTAIQLGGQQVTITGAPADGDSFSVTPATQGSTDVFANLSQLISTLQSPVDGDTASANFQSSLATSLTQLQNSLNNVTTMQASVGGRESEVKALATVTQTNTTQTSSNLADITQVNLQDAISKYTVTQVALQAAQQAFVKIQGMSLFQYLS